MKNIFFLGGGNMAQAMIAGMLKQGFGERQIYVADHNEIKRKKFESLGVQTSADINEFLPIAHVLILAVKPQASKMLCNSIDKSLLKADQIVISVMAGISTHTLQAWIGQPLTMIRAMPNTPAKWQAGATALFNGQDLAPQNRFVVESIMRAIGKFAWVDTEDQLNAITALSGSGPAYFLYFTECMVEAAIKLGLSPALAEEFAIETLRGAATLAHQAQGNVAAECERITSKKGTTDAALTSLRTNGLSEIVEKAMQAAYFRAQELNNEEFL